MSLFYINHVFTLDRFNIFLKLNVSPRINGKEWCPIYIYIPYIYIHMPRSRLLRRHTFTSVLLGPSKFQIRIATIYSWQSETGKPHYNIDSLYNMISIFRNIPDELIIIHSLMGMRYGVRFISERYVICALYVYVFTVIYVASCCSYGPCYIENTRCRNIGYSSLTRYPPYLIVLYSQTHEIIPGPIWYHGTHFNRGYKSPLKLQFPRILTLTLSQKKKKNRWHTGDSCLAFSVLMKTDACQLFLKFAYWVTAFWILWPGPLFTKR